jgi:hypothetical protein
VTEIVPIRAEPLGGGWKVQEPDPVELAVIDAGKV